MPQPSGPQRSEGRRRETFLPREEWAIGAPNRQAGWSPRGRKSMRRRCGSSDRGEAGLGQIRPSEATMG